MSEHTSVWLGTTPETTYSPLWATNPFDVA